MGSHLKLMVVLMPIIAEAIDLSDFVSNISLSNLSNISYSLPRYEWSGAVIQQVFTLSVIIVVTLVFGEWKLGPIACKVIVYAQIITLASTTFILTSMSYDRYLAICRPLKNTGGVKQAKRMILGSWLLAFIFAIPQIFIFVQVEEEDPATNVIIHKCISKGYTAPWQRKLYFTWLTCYILVIPAICICYCYINVLRTVWKAAKDHPNKGSSAVFLRRSQNAASMIPRAKIKTLKLTICIIASFIICWTPYFIVHNIRIYSNYTITISKNIILGVQTLALLNSALNPIFYGYFNVHLRKDFIEIVYRKKDIGSCLTGQLCASERPGDSWEANASGSINNHSLNHMRRQKTFRDRQTSEDEFAESTPDRTRNQVITCQCAKV